jgi:hypothetical protein
MLAVKSGAQYRAVVLPPLDSIGVRVAEKIHGFASAGLPIFLVGETPSRGDGCLKTRDQ